MAGRRASGAEIERRICVAVKMLSECASSSRVAQTLSAETGVTERQAWEYVSAARKRLVEIYQMDRDECVANELLKLDHIADRATATGQLSAAVGAVGLKLRVIGAHTPKN